MKRIFILILSVMTALCFYACADENGEESSAPVSSSSKSEIELPEDPF